MQSSARTNRPSPTPPQARRPNHSAWPTKPGTPNSSTPCNGTSRPMPRLLVVIAATLTLSSCASGARPTPATPCRADLSIAPAQLLPPPRLPDLHAASDDALLRNHVAVAQQYHALADQLSALLCSLGSQRGITINGAAPAAPADCGNSATPTH